MTLHGHRRRSQSWPTLGQQPSDLAGALAGNPVLHAIASDDFRTRLCPAARIALAQRQADESRQAAREYP